MTRSEASSRDDLAWAATRLRRCGVPAGTRLVQSADNTGEVLLGEIRHDEADLVVAGAWDRPRWAEQGFGGCKRTLPASLDVPAFSRIDGAQRTAPCTLHSENSP